MKRIIGTKTPSFKGLAPVSMTTAHAKRGNKRVDTKHELLLRRALWQMGLRYRKNVTILPGKPDIGFPGARLAVFCDGDFWHGRNWRELRRKLERGTNATYWSAKIAANIKRDTRNTVLLQRTGWHVIRLWETDVMRDPSCAATMIREAVQNLRTT